MSTKQKQRVAITALLSAIPILALTVAFNWPSEPTQHWRAATECDAAQSIEVGQIINFDDPDWDNKLVAYFKKHGNDCDREGNWTVPPRRYKEIPAHYVRVQ